MKEIKGNAWDLMKDYEVLCITTNGFVKANGECVMGRGIALEAKNKIPILPTVLGGLINKLGNNVHYLGDTKDKKHILSFPVKHHWREEADITLIERSAHQLVAKVDKYRWETVLIPRPGCGNGRLSWTDVKPVLEAIFDDRFSIVSF